MAMGAWDGMEAIYAAIRTQGGNIDGECRACELAKFLIAIVFGTLPADGAASD